MGVIVVGYIPTPEGLAALDWAIEHVRGSDGRLVVVNTGRNGDNSDPVFATPQDIDAIDGQLAGAGIEHEVVQSTGGAAASAQILQTADELGAELIVIGVRKRSPIGKYFAGSTAQEILLDAVCPVVAVKPRTSH